VTSDQRVVTAVTHFNVGMKDGDQITFHGEGDQEPGIEPGDILVILQELPHKVFKRQELG